MDRILRVDMTNLKTTEEPYPEEWVALGGRAIVGECAADQRAARAQLLVGRGAAEVEPVRRLRVVLRLDREIGPPRCPGRVACHEVRSAMQHEPVERELRSLLDRGIVAEAQQRQQGSDLEL